MFEFTGLIRNELYSEEGVNMAVTGLGDKIIVAPRGPYYEIDRKQEENTLTFKVAPSSGGTEKRLARVEVENGSENVTTNPSDWEIKITASSGSSPVKVDVMILDEEILADMQAEAERKASLAEKKE
jgi:hypothetical protein